MIVIQKRQYMPVRFFMISVNLLVMNYFSFQTNADSFFLFTCFIFFSRVFLRAFNLSLVTGKEQTPAE